MSIEHKIADFFKALITSKIKQTIATVADMTMAR